MTLIVGIRTVLLTTVNAISVAGVIIAIELGEAWAITLITPSKNPSWWPLWNMSQ